MKRFPRNEGITRFFHDLPRPKGSLKRYSWFRSSSGSRSLGLYSPESGYGDGVCSAYPDYFDAYVSPACRI